ncbi:MAG TPA: DNA-binding response regulator, partial [Undibacterium sp.]|nr:DNA-binding response regulator [Undibacterium sp.]
AKSAQHALQLVSYGLLLLDLGLPQTGGMDVLGGIRSAGSALPVIIITAPTIISSNHSTWRGA